MTNNEITILPLMLIRAAGLPLHWLDDLAADWPVENMPATGIAEGVQQAFDAVLQALPDSPLRTAVYNARRDFFQKRKTPAPGFFQQISEKQQIPEVIQLIDNLNLWNKYQTSQEEIFHHYESVLQDNYRLIQLAAREETLQRALLFSSHDLLQRLPFFTEKPVEDFNKKDRQTALSLMQYLIRAVVKTSPLSRFTTVGLTTSAGVPERDDDYFSISRPLVTPNVALLPALYEILLREPAFFRALAVLLNPCVTSVLTADQYWLYFDGEQESFQQAEPNPIAGFIVKTLLEKGRKILFIQLLSALEEEVDASPEQLQNLVFELIDYGLLEWELPEKGLSPGWCGVMYNFLGFLPEQPPVIVETASLLQWLRTAARTLTFQPVEDALAIQREAVALANDFFKKNGGTMPSLSAEQIFFEDVAETPETHVPEEIIQSLTIDLAACWRGRDKRQRPPFRARLYSYAEKNMAAGQVVDFLSFCKQFLEVERDRQAVTSSPRLTMPGREKIGALLQIFRDETGRYRAVVNGMFAGGGKLFARWLHLFPADAIKILQQWLNLSGNQELIHYPWQGWSNANFQPDISTIHLSVPDGRTRGDRQILLGNLAVKFDPNGLQLIDKETNEPVILTDLGLEVPESRPPSMQVLWHLGVPYVSLEAIMPHRIWNEGGPHWRRAERVTSGDLILARKTWQIDAILTDAWLREKSDAVVFRRIRTEMSAMEIPRRFFARFLREKPQYFDLDSPLSILMLAKMLRAKQSPLHLTEMLPLPGQCIVQRNGLRAAEFVLEFEI